MKKYIFNNQIVKASQYIDPTPCPGKMVPREETDKSIADIKELLGEISSKFKQQEGILTHYIFSIIDDKKSHTVHSGDWIIKNKNNFAILSDDIFQDMCIESSTE